MMLMKTTAIMVAFMRMAMMALEIMLMRATARNMLRIVMMLMATVTMVV